VERTFAWLGLSRCFSKDYERLPETVETMIYAVMSRIMLRKLATKLPLRACLVKVRVKFLWVLEYVEDLPDSSLWEKRFET
jgi:hypothetical protein